MTGAMERLAVIAPQDAIDLAYVPRNLADVRVESALVVVTGSADRDLLSLMRAIGSIHSVSILMVASATTPPALGEFHRQGVSTVVAADDRTWSNQWSRAVKRTWDAASLT